jgi:hypothetical protein
MSTLQMGHTLKDGILDYKILTLMHHLESYSEEFYHKLDLIYKTQTYPMFQFCIIKEMVLQFKLLMDSLLLIKLKLQI